MTHKHIQAWVYNPWEPVMHIHYNESRQREREKERECAQFALARRIGLEEFM